MIVIAKVKILTKSFGGRKAMLCAKECPHHDKYEIALATKLHCNLVGGTIELHDEKPFYKRHERCLKLKRA